MTQTKVLSRAEIEALGGTAQHIETQYGTLELNGYHQAADGTLTIDYSYVLTKAPEVVGADASDTIGVTATDRDGSTDGSSIAIKIVDDAPQAKDDGATIAEDSSTVSGNVLEDASSGATPGPDDVADTQGADGATVTDIASDKVPGNTPSDDGSGVLTIDGQYGTLEIHPDGSYTYALDNNNLAVQGLLTTESLTDTYTYTITDGDGDSSTATLTVTINGTDDGVTVAVPVDDAATTPDGVTTDQVVFESGLTEGSATNEADTQVNASFTVKALDGLSESGAITLSYQDVDGVTQTKVLSRAEIEALGGTAQHIETQYGTLELNGYHQAADGTLTIDYSYVLTKAPEVVGADASDTIGVTATDRDGSTDGSSIAIKIVDDAPQAKDDGATIAEDSSTVSGNVLEDASSGATPGPDDVADTQGADGATVTGIASENVEANEATEAGGVLTIDGQYGTLEIHPDGSYTYALDNNNLAVQGLLTTESLTDTYTYTITDGDGDSSTATLTITINGADDGVTVAVPVDDAATTPDGVTTDQVVFESGLAEGSATNGADTQVNASFTVKALDGLSESGAITLSYQDVDGVTQTKVLSRAEIEALGGTAQHIETQYGTLELNGYHQA
ncbi:VCBS domain-containing protein, partial [Candidimonas nitroreducens]